MRLPGSRTRRRTTRAPAIAVEPGERLLASCESDSAQLGGTRNALYLVDETTTRIPWDQIEAADWNEQSGTFRVSEVGRWGEQRRQHTFHIEEPQRLLELVRERVTASIVLQRHVPIDGRRGVRVIGRRAPVGNGDINWFYEYDEGIDPASPEVHEAASAALARARSDVGDS